MKIDGSKNTLDSQNGKAYKARRKGFQAKQKYADGPFLRVYYYVRPAVKQKNRPREFPKGGKTEWGASFFQRAERLRPIMYWRRTSVRTPGQTR